MTIEESTAIPRSERPTRPGYHNRRLAKTVLTGYSARFIRMSSRLLCGLVNVNVNVNIEFI